LNTLLDHKQALKQNYQFCFTICAEFKKAATSAFQSLVGIAANVRYPPDAPSLYGAFGLFR